MKDDNYCDFNVDAEVGRYEDISTLEQT